MNAKDIIPKMNCYVVARYATGTITSVQGAIIAKKDVLMIHVFEKHLNLFLHFQILFTSSIKILHFV